nr:hypothetical protein [Tanacetum cinerariifolium]
MIAAQVGDLSSHTTKCTSPALTQKSVCQYKKVGKGFSGVNTPLFEGMLVLQQAVDDVVIDNVPADDVVDVVADDVIADDVADVVSHVDVEPTPPSPTPTTTPPPPQQEVASTPPLSPHQSLQQPSSPPQQQQPSHASTISMELLNNLLEICTALTRRVENLEQDKIAQALEIIKLKQRVRRLEKRNKVKASGGIIALIDADEDVTLEEVDIAKDAEVEKNTDVQGRLEESQAQVYHIDLEHADKVLCMQDDEAEPAKLKKVIEVVTTAKLITEVVTATATTITVAAPSVVRRRKGVVIRDPEETATPSTIVHSELKSKDKGKGILVKEPKPLKKQAQIEQDKAYPRELEAKKNMMVYLKNMAGFKMNFFRVRGMASKALKRKSKSSEQQAAKKQKLDEEVEELKKHLQIILNDEDDIYTKATPLALKIVQEKFASLKLKNFSDDFLLYALKTMFEKPDVEAQVWKNQKGSYGLAKVKSWKLLESCGVHIITFTTTQMNFLVERRYPLTIFTLDQMLNNVRLEVEEESEVSLKLLRFVRRQQQEGYRPE